MASSLSSLVDTLAERIYKNKCKDCDCFFEYERVQDTLIKRKCLSCNKDYSNKLDEKLKKKFKKTLKLSDNDINKFFFLLRKGAHPHGYIDEWKEFTETKLAEKEQFCSNFNVTDAEYVHAKNSCMWKEFAKTLKKV